MTIEVLPATAERWPDLVDLFQRPGPRGGQPVTTACWCMAWRRPADTFRAGWGGRGESRGAGNRAEFQALVDGGAVPGVLAYDDGQAIGWCSIAPREEFIRLETSKALPRIDDRPVWSVVCFYVDWRRKGQGLGQRLLAGAVDYASSRGAELVEGYASKPGDKDPFTGFESMFERAGFVKVRDGGRRSTWRRDLRYV